MTPSFRSRFARLVACGLVVFAVVCFGQASVKPVPTTRADAEETFGQTRVHDPYRWLEGLGAWVGEQNAYTRSFLDQVPARGKIMARLRELFNLDTVAVPQPKRGRYFFVERKGGQDLGVLYVQEGLNAAPRVLIDQNTLSPDKKTVLAEWHPSEDGKLLAYGLSKAANDRKSLHVLDVDSGKNLPDEIPVQGYPHSIKWSHNGAGFWYTRQATDAPKNGEEKFYQRVFYHKLGDDTKNDVLVFGDGREKTDYLWAQASEDGRWLLVSAWVSTGEKSRTELYLKDLRENGGKGKFVTVVEGRDAEFNGALHRNTLYIQTNLDAPHWKIMSVPASLADKGVERWTTIIPESVSVIESFLPVRDRLFVTAIENAHANLREHALDGTVRREIPLPSLGSLSAIIAENEGSEVFFGFTSFVVPYNVYRLELSSGATSLFKKAEGGIRETDFIVEQRWFASKDGTKVPMFIVAAEFLIAENYTSKEKLAIFGWSNGGLLTGACLTQRPDLYKAVVIGAPVLDMLRYHLFDGGRLWIPDYGSAEEADMVPALLAYSPYHNVKDGTKYPATLILTAEGDDRVHPSHAYKMAARLQKANASQNPILLRVETKAGHAGAAAIPAVIEQYGDIWSFVFWQLGMP